MITQYKIGSLDRKKSIFSLKFRSMSNNTQLFAINVHIVPDSHLIQTKITFIRFYVNNGNYQSQYKNQQHQVLYC